MLGRRGHAGAASVGLGLAMSSSVVIVNITRSSRRTTNRATEQALLGWSVLQDITGVALAAVLIAIAGAGERPPVEAAAGCAAFVAVDARCGLAAAASPAPIRAEHDLFLIVSVGAVSPSPASAAVIFARPDGAGGLRRRAS